MIKIAKLTRLIVQLLLLFVFVISCAPAANMRSDLSSSIQLKKLDINGKERTYFLHLPHAYRSEAKLPLVIVLHGGGKGNGHTPGKYLGFTALADMKGFVVVYPNGIDDHWNDGRGVTYRGASDNSVDDVGFISQLIDKLIKVYKVDSHKVYVTGISNGGIMTLRLGCEISSKLAAIAPIAANIPKNIMNACKPDAPLPILLMDGTDDHVVPYNGGYVHFLWRKMGEVVSTKETILFWVRHNHCNVTAKEKELPDIDLTDGSRVTVTTYANPKNRCNVILYTIHGGGHTLPGSNIPDRPLLLGKKNKDINGAEVIWQFFQETIQ